MTVGTDARKVAGTHPAAVRLTPSFDAERLQAELSLLTGDTWRLQETLTEDGDVVAYPADWRVLPLRSPGGDPSRTDGGGPGVLPFQSTAWLRACPYLAEILGDLPAEVRSARLMALAPGAGVGTHRDTPLGFAKGMVRLHIPITTNDEAVLVLDGETHHWQPGTFWYGDFSRPHSIANHGRTARVHLVVDCAVTPRLLELFPPGFRGGLAVTEVLFQRPEVPLRPAEAAAFSCRFAMPAEFRAWSGESFDEQDGDPSDRRCEVRASSEGLVLSIGGHGPEDVALVHVGAGEFRLRGWTEERTVQIDRAAGKVRFFIRDGSAWHTSERPLTGPG
jgi:hypothetical protein